MSKPLKKLTSIFTHSERHIKYDGSGYHSGPIRSIFERPGFNASLLASLGCVTIGLIQQGNFDITTAKMLGVMGGCVAGTVCTIVNESGWADAGRQFNKAIDTQGADLSRASLDESSFSTLKKMRIVAFGTAGFVLSALSTLLFMDAELKDASTAIAWTVSFGLGMSTFYTASAWRTHKLIKGHTTNEDNVYVFCDKPPGKPAKKQSFVSILGKSLNPN